MTPPPRATAALPVRESQRFPTFRAIATAAQAMASRETRSMRLAVLLLCSLQTQSFWRPGLRAASRLRRPCAGGESEAPDSVLDVQMSRPLGIRVFESRTDEAPVVVVTKVGEKAEAAGVRKGDVIVGVSAIFGDGIWSTRYVARRAGDGGVKFRC